MPVGKAGELRARVEGRLDVGLPPIVLERVAGGLFGGGARVLLRCGEKRFELVPGQELRLSVDVAVRNVGEVSG